MAITMIVGHPGEGKTLYQSYLVNKAVWENPTRPIFTNYKISIDRKTRYYILANFRIPKKIYLFFEKILPKKIFYFLRFAYLAIPENNVFEFQTLDQLYNVNNAIIVIDEMATLFSNREWKNTPPWFLVKLAMHRHEGLDLIGTAQRYDGVDNIIRELTKNVYWVQKYFNGKIFKISSVHYHPILPGTEIKFFDLFFPTKRDFKRFNSWDTNAYKVDTGRQTNYKPDYEKFNASKIKFES